MRTLAAPFAFAALLAACGTPATSDVEARVRNAPPATCAEADFAVCPELAMVGCADGSEPVIDYSSDCCPHFSCQPRCVSAEICTPTPAPICPEGTELWIGTALEDCCPAYRCEPTSVCTEEIRAACPLGIPYCGEGVEPIVVGETDDCCPIYQCPCDVVRPDGTTSSDPSLCGCTYPVCGPGEQLVCLGDNICGYPCECQPFAGDCLTDEECGVGMMCDTSLCLPAPGCDPATGLDASGAACPTVCAGLCVPRAGEGCGSDLECPADQYCSLVCETWECDTASGVDCGCPPDDTTGACACRSDGTTTYCSSSSCRGVCLPSSTCTPSVTTECMPPLVDCVTVVVGTDPTTCCPIYDCATCVPPPDVACAVLDCPDGGMTYGVDENCCPLQCCTDAAGNCTTRS